MTLLDTLALVLAAGYALLQLRWWRSWLAVPAVIAAPSEGKAPRRTWSVVIAARNEAGCIGELLRDLGRQGLPPLEVIVVDDHSTDATASEVARYEVRGLVLPKGQTGKKAALAFGIASAEGDWVATLDADTRIGPDWLAALDVAAAQETVAVAGPVALTHDGSWWQRWQSLDFTGMMAITAASLRQGHFAMGNGANLAFAKTAFAAVNGYETTDGKRAASGDDMVLLGKLLAQYPNRVAFAKIRQAEVQTPAEPSVRGFVQQRLRWSAKTGLNLQPVLTATLGWTWAFHLGLLLGLVLAAGGPLSWWVVAVCWTVKLVVDLMLLRSATDFFARRRLLDWTYPVGSLVHAVYVAGIGTLAVLPIEFEWKGRRHRR